MVLGDLAGRRALPRYLEAEIANCNRRPARYIGTDWLQQEQGIDRSFVRESGIFVGLAGPVHRPGAVQQPEHIDVAGYPGRGCLVGHQFNTRHEIYPAVPGSLDHRQRVQQAATVPGDRRHGRQLRTGNHDVLFGNYRTYSAALGGLQVLLEAKELVRAVLLESLERRRGAPFLYRRVDLLDSSKRD